MRKNPLFYMIPALIICSSCSKETNLYEPYEKSQNNQNEMTLKVSMPTSNISRVGFDKEGKFYWSEDDVIGVQGGDGFTTFFIESGVCKQNAIFLGNIEEKDLNGKYVVYPFNTGHSINQDDKTLTYCLPDHYKYGEIDSDFFDTEETKSDKRQSFNAPMYGIVNQDMQVHLKHLGGVLCIKMNNSLPQGENLELSFQADQQLNGNFNFTITPEGPQLIKPTNNFINTEKRRILITYNHTEGNTTSVFYIPVFEGLYSGMSIYLKDSKDLIDIKGIYAIKRGTLKVIELNEKNIPVYHDDSYKAFQSYLLGLHDTNKDGKLSEEETNLIQKLEIDGQKLEIDGQKINEIYDLSIYPNLKELSIKNFNTQEIDLSQLPSLETLVIDDNSKFNKLNVSDCKKLTSVTASNTGLNDLNVDGCTELRTLTCSESKLNSLNLSSNTKLESLDCSNSNLNSLDLSANTELRTLNCSKSKLNSLNLSSNTKLESLDCSYSNLESLDLSVNNKLKTLNCSSNPCTKEHSYQRTIKLWSTFTYEQYMDKNNPLTFYPAPQFQGVLKRLDVPYYTTSIQN